MTDENDCEDQGFTSISDGCFVCPPSFDIAGKPIRRALVATETAYGLQWMCPQCHGSYGFVNGESS